MAAFCKTCADEMGFDTDLDGIAKPEWLPDRGALVLCECCGPIVVDPDGLRMSAEFSSSCKCGET